MNKKSKDKELKLKKVLNQLKSKKAAAAKLMSRKQRNACLVCINSAAGLAAAAGAIPIPVADAAPICAFQTTMVIGLGKVFGKSLSESAIKGILSSAGATLLARAGLKAVPVVGWVGSAALAFAVTELMGWTIAVDLAQDAKKQWDRENGEENSASVSSDKEQQDEYITIIQGLEERAGPFLRGEKTPSKNREELDLLKEDFTRVVTNIVDPKLKEIYYALHCLDAQEG